MNNKRKQTIRQEIVHLLTQGPLTVRDISQIVSIMEKDVYHHLSFIEKSVRQQQKRICVEPYSCQACGFQFKNRKTFKRPGKCPMCRQSRIAPAVFWIE